MSKCLPGYEPDHRSCCCQTYGVARSGCLTTIWPTSYARWLSPVGHVGGHRSLRAVEPRGGPPYHPRDAHASRCCSTATAWPGWQLLRPHRLQRLHAGHRLQPDVGGEQRHRTSATICGSFARIPVDAQSGLFRTGTAALWSAGYTLVQAGRTWRWTASSEGQGQRIEASTPSPDELPTL